MYGLTQLTNLPTRITSSSSTLIDHILTNAQENISQYLSFPNYENFDNSDVPYSDFITRLDCVIKAIAPFKTVRIKNNPSEWLDGEIKEKIHKRDKL